MKYIIMCGGTYEKWNMYPRHLTEIKGEKIIERTIRLLEENGVKDIAISANDSVFAQFGVPVLYHENTYYARAYNDTDGYWCECFYPTNEPVCYIFGDVVFSPEAIKKIVETDTGDIEFFASAPPFSRDYPKQYAEPFALKVVNTTHLKMAIDALKQFDKLGKFKRKPIMWELWQVIKNTPFNIIDYTNYTVINDYTCDIDNPEDVKRWQNI